MNSTITPHFSNQTWSISHIGKPFLMLLLVFCVLATPVWGQEDYVAGDLQLRGLMGGKLKIEMHIVSDGQIPLLNRTDKDCFEVTAAYYYRTQLIPIGLSGRFCASNHTFFLEDQPSPGTKERFEGKWDPAKRKLSGTWTLKSSGKTMPFELTSVDAGVSSSDLQKFFSYLNDDLVGEGDAEGASIESATWTAQGGKIIGFHPSWSGYLEFLSPMRLRYTTGYNSTARSSYYENVYQLLPTAKGPFILVSSYSSNYDKGYDDQGESEDGNETCSVTISILQYNDGSWDDVATRILPKGSQISSDENAGAGCGVMVLSDAIKLPDGSKVYWDGNAFMVK